MPSPSRVDAAGRAIAGLLGYNPGPGIYSRLERAVEAMPANVRVEELPGLLKRYKEGVPGWELREADFPGLIGDAKVIPRQDLLDRVRQQSPVYTHGELLLQGKMEPRPLIRPEGFSRGASPDQLTGMRPLGRGVPVGDTKFQDYGQGGDNYGELLLIQPGADGQTFGSHWGALPGGMRRTRAANSAVAHARFDTHGDALRINELQSDLGIHNRKMREQGGAQMTYDAPSQLTTESDADYAARLSGLGFEVQWLDDGNLAVGGRAKSQALPFPLEDAWSDILLKRLALEAAHKGHRAIEVASPRAIADTVGGNIDNYEHFYGKVVPGAIERLGRKMGGLTAETPRSPLAVSPVDGLKSEFLDLAREISNEVPARARDYFDTLVNDMRLGNTAWTNQRAEQVAQAIAAAGITDPGAMPRIMSLAHRRANALDAGMSAQDAIAQRPSRTAPPGRRYIMSDEMRKRILTQGIGASLLAPMAGAAMEE